MQALGWGASTGAIAEAGDVAVRSVYKHQWTYGLYLYKVCFGVSVSFRLLANPASFYVARKTEVMTLYKHYASFPQDFMRKHFVC